VRTQVGRPATIDEYLKLLDRDQRAALEKLRATIRAAVPRGEECISYGLPCIRLDGRMLVHFGAAAHHCAFYPGGIVREFEDDLAGFETSKGTIRFTPNRSIPAAVVRKIVKALVARQMARAEQRGTAKTARRSDVGATSRRGTRVAGR
jgi:uncharacterized protein YdhG (YjbR/CyaY superfamily)